MARHLTWTRCRSSHWRDTPRQEGTAITNGEADVEPRKEGLASPIGETPSAMHSVCSVGLQCFLKMQVRVADAAENAGVGF